MRQATRLSVEILEGKALLSGVAAVGSDLSTTLTVDRSAYAPGQPVAITFTETNVSHHDVTVIHGPVDEGFVVSRDGREVWRSNAGLEPQFLEREVLHPGQSIKLQSTWDGRPDVPSTTDPSAESSPLKGTFVIHNELTPNGPTATVTIGARQAAPSRPTDRLR